MGFSSAKTAARRLVVPTCVAVMSWLLWAAPTVAEAAEDEESAKEETAKAEGKAMGTDRFRLRFEIKANARTSELEEVKLKFPFPPEFIPEGEDGVYERTVDEGTSFEISNVAIRGDAELTPHITGRVNVHVIDLYNRNPTSSDDLVALREAWIRFGRRQDVLEEIPGTTFFAELGKAPRFTKQIKRHLESYGLWGTAVGRFEEIGLQIGGSFGEHVYYRASITNGNPLFFRDPNALAGDNGTPERKPPDPDPVFESGFPILYDAKAQDVNLDDHFMLGAGLGLRFTWEDDAGLDLLGWYFEREMEDAARIRGTFYQGDLELLRGAGIPLPYEGRDKIEYGCNVNAAWKGLHVYGQYVVQEIAELPREGFEVELGYRIPLNGVFVSGDEPVLNWIEPVARYSVINNEFVMPPDFVAPSVGWDWRKLDVGFRLGIIANLDLTMEYAFHDMILKTKVLHPNEGLLTLRLAF